MTVELFRYLDSAQMPQAFEEISRQAIRNRMETDIIAATPQIDATVPQPLSQILDVAASYVANLRRDQNNQRLGTFTRFATGANIIQRAFEKGLTPEPGESETSLRARALAAPYGSTATRVGLEGAVLNNIMFSDRVKGISFVYNAVTGQTTFYPLAQGMGQKDMAARGIPTDALKAELDTFLSADTTSILSANDFIPADPTVTPVYLTIKVTVPPGQAIADISDEILEELEILVEETFNLGNSITQQELFAHFNPLGYALSISRLNTANDLSVADIPSPNLQTALLLSETNTVVEAA